MRRAARRRGGFALRTLAQLMAPMTPHLAEEIWAVLGGEGLVRMRALARGGPGDAGRGDA